MFKTASNFHWPLFFVLMSIMAATRSHHFASATHLPDASWAVFFLAGFYLRTLWTMAILLGVAAVSDAIAIGQFGVSDYCISPAYVGLLPAYGALWFAGRQFGSIYRFNWSALPLLGLFASAGALVCELLSSGSFYLFSGRFAELDMTTFVERLIAYFPQNLAAVGLYLGSAALVHCVLILARGGAHAQPAGTL